MPRNTLSHSMSEKNNSPKLSPIKLGTSSELRLSTERVRLESLVFRLPLLKAKRISQLTSHSMEVVTSEAMPSMMQMVLRTRLSILTLFNFLSTTDMLHLSRTQGKLRMPMLSLGNSTITLKSMASTRTELPSAEEALDVPLPLEQLSSCKRKTRSIC